MVAILLGAIVIAGAVSVYLGSKRSYTEVEQFSELSENGRFAIQLMTYSLRHGGFFGAAKGGDISRGPDLGSVSGDCGAGSGADASVFNTTDNLIAFRSTDGNAFSCIGDAATNSDVLVIKSARPSPRYDADPADPNQPKDGVISFVRGGGNVFEADQAYLIANSEAGVLIDGDDVTKPDVSVGGPMALAVAWPYVFEAFYVQNLAEPTLTRLVLERNGANWSLRKEQLVPGVEAMNFRFGMDTTGNGNVDTYTNAAGVGGDWDRVVVAEIFLLMRTLREDPRHTDEKTYQVADRSLSGAALGARFHRVLLSGSVNLRNPGLTLRAGG
ncbi:hypothetical protein GCM10027297_18710 [Parahaliea aestuarii]